MLVQLRDGLTIFALAASISIAAFIGYQHVMGTAILVLLALAWFTLDADWEGGVLIDFGGGHGLTQADLFGLIGLGVAAHQLWRRTHR